MCILRTFLKTFLMAVNDGRRPLLVKSDSLLEFCLRKWVPSKGGGKGLLSWAARSTLSRCNQSQGSSTAIPCCSFPGRPHLAQLESHPFTLSLSECPCRHVVPLALVGGHGSPLGSAGVQRPYSLVAKTRGFWNQAAWLEFQLDHFLAEGLKQVT